MIGISLTVYLICVFLISRWYVQGLKIEYLSKDIIDKTEIIEKEEHTEEEDNSTDNNSDNNEEVDNV